jgi:hypothetical protein
MAVFLGQVEGLADAQIRLAGIDKGRDGPLGHSRKGFPRAFTHWKLGLCPQGRMKGNRMIRRVMSGSARFAAWERVGFLA